MVGVVELSPDLPGRRRQEGFTEDNFRFTQAQSGRIYRLITLNKDVRCLMEKKRREDGPRY